MAEVQIIKYDVGSPTDEAMGHIRKAIHGTSVVDAFRRSVAIAYYVTQAQAEGRKIFVQNDDGNFVELV